MPSPPTTRLVPLLVLAVLAPAWAALAAAPAVPAEQVAVFPECDLAVRWVPQTFVPVTIQLREPAKAVFRAGAVRSAIVYEDYSAVNMVGGHGPKRVAIEVQRGVSPRHPFDAAFLGRHAVARQMLAPAALGRQTGLTDAEVRSVADLERWRTTPKDGSPAFDVLAFRTPRFTYLFSRREDPKGELGCRIQFPSRRPIRATIDLTDPQYRFFRW